MITLKSTHEIQLLRRAGAVAAQVLELMKDVVKPGISTKELDTIAEEYILSKGGIPSFKGYEGYPASICTSVNCEVVHGIPGKRILKDGDIISIDVGVQLDGYHGDTARTYAVGNVEPETLRLMRVTEKCLYEGIKMAVPGNRIGDIGHAVQQLAEGEGFSVVRALVGHGVGQNMHEPPEVPNFGKPGHGVRLREGMVIAIEPMINLGTYDVVVLDDDWTVEASDGKPSAHYEHTIAILKDGPMILTAP